MCQSGRRLVLFTGIFAKKNVSIFSKYRTARIGDTVLQVEAGDFIAYPAGGEAHDLRNTGSSQLKCIIVGQRLDFDIVDYPEQARRLYCANGEKGDLVDMAVIVPRH